MIAATRAATAGEIAEALRSLAGRKYAAEWSEFLDPDDAGMADLVVVMTLLAAASMDRKLAQGDAQFLHLALAGQGG